jgi:hypothetical protein
MYKVMRFAYRFRGQWANCSLRMTKDVFTEGTSYSPCSDSDHTTQARAPDYVTLERRENLQTFANHFATLQ